ncbi:MAG: adenosylcobalamin-dependent ribonucleoside-diphosphate reductase [Phycisphaeraceae bacterium]|nr:adenosylcobalamin-dependent ribonucleoside-diphosphate reductase [Phycisphaerales bacterium]MCB9861653.1 adenosylcobalamin-dependent ribonucleoside-diphosphate reductase [Phycisphaeraceae bacterium]
MKVTRRFTMAGTDPFATTEWVQRSSKITNPDGSVVFEMKDAEVPAGWSQLATDIMVSKYFRKAGVPQFTHPYAIPGASGAVQKTDASGKPETGPERSARQVIHRLAFCWTHWGQSHNYFDTTDDAHAFYDELVYMMVHQMCAPNSPQWFNTGLQLAYGITGPAQGHYVADPQTGNVTLAADAYSNPQPHACFIQSVSDDLVNDGGIMDLWVREARLFKYGSGTGTNFSSLRGEGEPLSGGGKSSGLMSWLRIGDRAASAIKSGGTTRRAAKMVCLDMDHPDIREFVNWKVREEIKVASLVEGLKLLKQKREDIAKTAGRVKLDLDYDFNGEAYQTVSGQNSNNSIRIPDAFFDAVDADGDWTTRWRTNGQVAHTFKASELWNDLNYAAWRCADPGVQYDTTINAWHTCPNGGRINASNPCSEYMFLDNTACNLASLNMLKFYDSTTRTFDVAAYEHGVDLWTTVLEISVLMAAFPSEKIAELSWKYRTLGLGYANLGAMLMQAGIPYDSDEARAVCACLTSIMTGRSYAQSACLASEHGAFPGYADDRENMLRVIRNHRHAAHGAARDSSAYENLRIRPVPIDHGLIGSGRVNMRNIAELGEHAKSAWDDALELGLLHGYRNAQVTVIAPTGTIGLLMDCDTTGVEPDFALVKFKKLAGGGYFKIANASVKPALRALGYADNEIKGILEYLLGALHLNVPMPTDAPSAKEGQTFAQWLLARGMTEEDLHRIGEALPSVFELKFAFGSWALGDACLQRLSIDPEHAKANSAFNALAALGLSSSQIDELNTLICGTQTVEGSPHLKADHLPVFDCANTCGKIGKRFIAPTGHIRMMAASQPFISGAISKTINLPNSATVEDIASCYRMSWELGLKANALYRDGCKLSQPLNNTSDKDEELLDDDDTDAEIAEARAEVADGVMNVAKAVAETAPVAAEKETVRIVERPMRRRLPDTRQSITHKFNIAGHEGYLNVGLYENGEPGELFITMAKEGSTIGGLMDTLGTAVSVAMQYGVPIESLVRKFSYQRFEPAGMTTNPDIPFAKSLVDYIFRWLGMQFVEGYREQHAPKRSNPMKESLSDRGPDRNGSSSEKQHRLKRDVPYGGLEAVAAPGSRTQTPPSDGGAMKMVSSLSASNQSMGDAPACDVCGEITVRNGTCYKCLNCGATTGCS